MYFGTLCDLFYQDKEWISKLPKVSQLDSSKPVILRIINKYYQLNVASQKLNTLKNENIQTPSKKYKMLTRLLSCNKRPNSNKKKIFSEITFKRCQSLKKVKSDNYNLLNFPKIPINKTLVKSSDKDAMTTNIHLYKNLTEVYNRNMNINFIRNIIINNQKSALLNIKDNKERCDSSDSRYSYRKKLNKYKSEIKKVILSSGNFLLNDKNNEIHSSPKSNFNDIHKENLSSSKDHHFLNRIRNKKDFKLKFNTKVKLVKNDLIGDASIKISRSSKKNKKFVINLSNIKLDTIEKKNNKNIYKVDASSQTIQNDNFRRQFKNKFKLNSIITKSRKRMMLENKFENQNSKFCINNLQPLYTINS